MKGWGGLVGLLALSAPATVTKTSMQASFGALGEIAVTFHGFTPVEATSAKGDLGSLLDLLCPGISGGSGGPFLSGAELSAPSGPSRQSASVRVVKNRPSARAHYEAEVSEVHEGVSINRFTDVVESANTFVFDSKVQTATVHPSVPFSGTGRFKRAAKPANQWSGNLTVDLPGRAGVELTGGDDRAKLAHAHWDFHPNSSSNFR